MFILLNYPFSINNHANQVYKKSLILVGTYFLFSMVFVGSGTVSFDTNTDPAQLLKRIPGNHTDSDPDQQH